MTELIISFYTDNLYVCLFVVFVSHFPEPSYNFFFFLTLEIMARLTLLMRPFIIMNSLKSVTSIYQEVRSPKSLLKEWKCTFTCTVLVVRAVSKHL